ncbi:MAG TPA: hypothetical protein VJP60_05850 [Rhizomicrobium sp.]|nr:hypothetical protein [Rhizomicrobium sp.]
MRDLEAGGSEMATVSRYLVERTPDQVRTAFQGIVDICALKGISRVTLVVPQKGGWERTILAEFLGEARAKALLKGQAIPVINGVTMILESAQTFQGNASQGLVVGAHISDKAMAKIDDSWDAQAILYMPWVPAEGQAWQAIWKPETIGPSTSAPPPDRLSPKVVAALERLSRHINLGTGLSHPSDKAHAVRVIANLRAEGHSFDPAEIKRWALRHAWSSGAAAELEAVARKAR